MITLRDVRFGYSPEFGLVIDELIIPAGQTVACIGASGSGKTTLVNLVAGIVVPQHGDVDVLGERISAMGEPARREFRLVNIGMVFQEFELLEYLSAGHNILLNKQIGENTPSLSDRAREVSARAGIAHLLHRKPARLSQGERQRVALCRALVTRPGMILCDEPTGNLDPRSGHAVVDLLLGQARECGATMLMVTHDHGLLRHFDRVIEMSSLARAWVPRDHP